MVRTCFSGLHKTEEAADGDYHVQSELICCHRMTPVDNAASHPGARTATTATNVMPQNDGARARIVDCRVRLVSPRRGRLTRLLPELS